MSQQNDKNLSFYGATLSRRRFLASGGVMAVSLSLFPGTVLAGTTEGSTTTRASLDASLPKSWIEIHADNSIVIRTGKCDFGQGSIYTAYPQIVADELGVPFEAITNVVGGDTDRTPDGGGTFGLLRTNVLNLRKVAAFTREAILELAAERFGVSKDQLSIDKGIISAGSKSVSYGELVSGQDLNLEIPVSGELISFRGLVVEGNPPLKPASEYKVVGHSFKNPIITDKVTAKAIWATDVALPNMLHARVIHPATLGSTLISAGELDSKTFPTAKVIVKGNLVGVVAEDEWEAVRAYWTLRSSTKWSEWKGLPGHKNLHGYLRKDAKWDVVPVTQGGGNQGNAPAAISGAAKTHKASYEIPYMKHAPIGPSMALAEVRKDGSVTVHTFTQNPQSLRLQIAMMLDVSTDKVVIRTYPGSGHYGRSNGGNAGAEDEAVLLSQAVGRPVRLQWMRGEDMQWSTQSAPAYADINIGVKDGKIIGYQADHYGPPMQDDRPVGALLSSRPTIKGPVPENQGNPVQGMANFMADNWVYGNVSDVAETAHSTWQLGQQESPLGIGLRDHSLRTPTQFQQNFPREVAISEAAALAGVDPIQFRIDNIQEKRLQRVLEVLRKESDWDVRPSPHKNASANGDQPQRGQGVSTMFRGNAYWACACHVAVKPASGELSVERLTVVVDPGVVVNPDQLKRQIQAGALMGLSQALHEEVSFDESAVTAQDWISYPILKMAEMPEVKVVLAPDPDVDIYGQGSEGANALAPSAIAAAVFDATGKPARRLPLRTEWLKQEFASQS